MTKPMTYQAAGVNINAGNTLIDRIKPHAKRTHRPEVLGGLGGFGACFAMPTGYRNPVLVSATDGVGSKLKLALEHDHYDGLGIDLVAMCVNDLITLGAQPLFFLDYYACGRLDIERATQIISSIADGCEQSGASLVGGETAEMPGCYQNDDYDLAGFCVGVVERDQAIHGQDIQAGDQLIGLASSGIHSNGYSLVRHMLNTHAIDVTQPFGDTTLIDTLLTPTRIYVKSILSLLTSVSVKGIAHITGGGLPENLVRILPEGLNAKLNANSWTRPEIFDWLQSTGKISDREMQRTFNCGVGMILCVDQATLEPTLTSLASSGETAWHIGTVSLAQPGQHRVELS